MALIKCENCGKDISTNANKCIHCNTEIKQTTKINVVNRHWETEKNINYFLKLAKIIKIVLFIIAGIVFLVGMLASDGISFEIIIISSIVSVVLILCAILSTPFLEWKAYMLKNLYELNMKGGK